MHLEHNISSIGSLPTQHGRLAVELIQPENLRLIPMAWQQIMNRAVFLGKKTGWGGATDPTEIVCQAAAEVGCRM